MILMLFLLFLVIMSYLHNYGLFLGIVPFATLLVSSDIAISSFGLYSPAYDETEAWLCNVCQRFFDNLDYLKLMDDA